MEGVLREVFFFCVAFVLGVAMRLAILGVAIKPLEVGVLITDGLLWDLHVSVVNWLSLCLGGTADADAGGSEGLFTFAILGPVPERRNNSIPGINVPYSRDNFMPGINSVPERRNSAIQGINLG